jgi:hypothetical protein
MQYSMKCRQYAFLVPNLSSGLTSHRLSDAKQESTVLIASLATYDEN